MADGAIGPQTQVAVFHPGTQHSWQTALALQQLGRLAWYATSIYYQPDRWPYRLERMLPAAAAARLGREFGRFHHPGLDPAKVRTSGAIEWLERVAARIGWRLAARRLDLIGNRRFAASLASDIAGQERFALWGYNGSSAEVFAQARTQGRPCILDRTNGDFRAYNSAMDEVAELYPQWFVPLERRVPERIIAGDDREYALADTILVGSRFAAETLRAPAVDPAVAAKLRVLHYCYDEALFAGLPPPRPVDRARPVRFLFVGQLIPRKGIHHVLEAIARIPRSAAELTLVGDLLVPPEAFAPYADRVTHIRTVARAEIPAIMAAHHVLLFPSYFEGAGIVLYEALAASMALIQSDRAARAVTPETGILLGRPETESLHAAIMAVVEDRDRLDAMRAAAQGAAQAYTFARYRNGIADLLGDLGL